MTELTRFRDEIRAWLLDHAPPSMRTPYRALDELCWGGQKVPPTGDAKRWLEVAASRGFTAPTWPKELGGGGLSAAEARVLSEEMRALSLRPPLVGFGLAMIGPLLLQAGSDELKRRHVPAITRGEIRWCQGYSEPGAGSDLASLATRAVRDGDDYVVNGSKIWTSYAEKADWMFLLVRTSTSGRKQDGITFLLLDMTTPGVSVRPIRLISGASPFCETFLTDVRIPVANTVGHENGGWAMARALLAHERTMIGDAFQERDAKEKLVARAREYIGEDDGRVADPVLRDRIAALEIEQACFDLTLARVKAAGGAPGHESSILKLVGTELNQTRRDLTCAILGPDALGSADDGAAPGYTAEELETTREWLRSRGNTIEGGTSEIQLNIIAKRVLALPGA